MIRRPPRSTRTDTLFPYTTLFRSDPYAFLTPLPPLSPLAIITENWIARAAERDQWPILAIIAEQNLLPRLFHSLIAQRSEEHTSELQSLMRISYAVFCLKKKKTTIFKQISHIV